MHITLLVVSLKLRFFVHLCLCKLLISHSTEIQIVQKRSVFENFVRNYLCASKHYKTLYLHNFRCCKFKTDIFAQLCFGELSASHLAENQNVLKGSVFENF